MRRSYPTSLPREGWAEQDANRWRSAALGALGALVHKLGPGRKFHAIGVTGQCPSVVPVDRRGEPLRPGMIYRDNRATVEAAEIRQRLGDSVLHQRTGHVIEAFHVAAKMRWLLAHEPQVFAATHRFLEPSDFVLFSLTGEFATDWSMAAANGLFDLQPRRWASDLLTAVGLDAAQLPAPHPSWEVIGEIRSTLVHRLGLAEPVPVVAGLGDSIACTLGAGVIGPGPVSEMAGSSTCLNSVVQKPLSDLRVTHYPSAVRSTGYVTEVGMNTTGAAVDWVAKLAFGGRGSRPTAADFSRLDEEAASTPPGSYGLLVLPVLGDGERDDPYLRGAAVGMSLRHGRAAWARATLEGVALGIRAHLDVLAMASTSATELRVSGGAARIAAWNQIKADVLGIPVRVISADAAALGAAMVAGLGSGVYADSEAAIDAAVRPAPTVQPIPRHHETYEAVYDRYQAVLGSPVIRVGNPVVGT